MPAITKKGLKKRKEILYQTAVLLKNAKYDHITVREICEASHVSVGTFYHYFEKKEMLAVEIFKLIDGYVENTLVPALTSDDEMENIIGYCVGFVRYTCKMGVCFCQSMNSISLNPKIYPREMEHRRPLYTALRELIIKGQNKGQISAAFDPDSLTDTILLVVRGSNFDWARRGGGYQLDEWVREIAERTTLLFRPQRALS